jgi:hypothetical protein
MGALAAVTKLAPIGPVRSGCLNCPPKPARLNLNWNHHPGFGFTSLSRDGEQVTWDVHGNRESHGRHVERLAAADPDHDWRFRIEGPLSGAVYQRQGDKTWLAVERLDGFA